MVFVFGECALDVDRRELRRAGVVCPLEPKAFTVLVHLLTQRHRAVTKDELLAAGWPGEFVTESALTRCLKVLRRTVGDDGGRQHIIKTVRGYGYRFVATVKTLSTPPSAPLRSNSGPALASVRPGAEPTGSTPGRLCLQCQTINRATRQFCSACGQALWVPCPQCGFGNDPTERFCGGCGRDVAAPVPVAPGARMGPPQAYTPAHLAQRLLTTPLPPPGARQQGTILVGAVEGLRTLRQAADLTIIDDVLNRGFALLVAEVHRVEGAISQVAGPGFTALFGAPLACEDHVLRALHAAHGIRRAFTSYAAEVQQTMGVSLALRLGVHTGPLIVSASRADLQHAYTTPGAILEVATELQQLAPVGAIAVSAAVYEAAAGFFQFTTLGAYTIPETAAPAHVYTCDSVGPVGSRLEGTLARGRTAFQGRRQELALLQACWARVCRGEGQVVCLVGDAGIGKSRLAYEGQRALGAGRWLTVQPLSYGHAMPYHAFIPLLRTVLGVKDTSVPAVQRQEILSRLAVLDPTLAADAPLLASLLGVPLETETLPALALDAQRWRLQHACLQVLQQQAADMPLGLLVEDGHWLDPSSQELLDRLVATLARRPILVLCTARPGFRHAWADHTYFHQVAVAPLADAETTALLHDLLQPYTASVTLTALICERTEGNPFFVEELVRVLQAHGLLTLQGSVYEVGAAARRTLPASIQGVVQARLDRLPEEAKHLLQAAAIIGPEMPLALLQAAVEWPEDGLHEALRHLQAAELLYETHGVLGRTYTFKHALIQDTAFQSLLRSTRQPYHQRLAHVLEARFPETAATQPERLAYHYTEAGLMEPAIAYWQKAGRRAYERSAHLEAIEHLTKGVELLMTLPDTPARARQELVLQIALGASLLMSKGPSAPAVEHTYARARALCQEVGDIAQLFRVLFALSDIYINRAEHKTARDLAEQLLDLAQRLHHPVSLLVAHYALGSALGWLGKFARAREHLDQALALHMHQPPARSPAVPAIVARVASHCYAAFTLWMLGYPDQALGRVHEALTLAQDLAHPYSIGVALHYAGWVHWLRREAPAVLEHAEAQIALATQHGFVLWRAGGTILRGCALTKQESRAEGIKQLQQGIAAWRATGADAAVPFYLCPLAEAYGEAGRTEEAQHLLWEAMALVEHKGERFWEAELHRLQGELRLRQPSPHEPQGEADFHQALVIARRQQAKSLELRAAMSLSRLWQRQGKRAEARELLTPIYSWFTEGLDTADLQEAKALLNALGA